MRHGIERLEARHLLSTVQPVFYSPGLLTPIFNVIGATLTSKGTLLVQGGLGNQSIQVSKEKRMVIRLTEGASTVVNSFALSQVKRVRIEGGSGNDSILISGDLDVPTTVVGGAGNDVINGGATDAILSGGDGNDSVSASTLTFKPDGGAGLIFDGDSTFREGSVLVGGMGNDTIRAGSGHDTILGGGGTDVLSVVLSGGAAINLQDPSPGDTLDSIEAVKPAIATTTGEGTYTFNTIVVS